MKILADQIFATLGLPWDSKLANLTLDEDRMIVETIPEYLLRVDLNSRYLGLSPIILFPPGTYEINDFLAQCKNGPIYWKQYVFDTTIEDIGLVELIITAAQGIQGIAGGEQGIQGLIGSQGDLGETSQGTQGLQGDVGIQGHMGTLGLPGIQGLRGSQGTSIQGTQGLLGIQGFRGLQGIQGAAASGSFVQSVNATDDPIFPISYLTYIKDGIQYPITEIPKPDGLISGGYVSWITGLSFSTTLAAYYIKGIFHTANSTQVILDAADPTHSRIDVIAINDVGQVVVIKGIPSANPQKPSIDPETQIELTQILITAGATIPGIDETIIYDENIEWAGSVSGTTGNFAYTIAPFNGVRCTNITTISNNDTVTYTKTGTINTAIYGTLTLFIKLKALLSNQHNIYVGFLNGGTLVSNEIVLPSLNKTNITTWQNIVIPLTSFTFSSTIVNAIRFRWRKQGANTNHAGFYLDFIKFQGGVIQPPITGNIILTGDVSGIGVLGSPTVTTLATVNANVGQFGDATNIPQLTVDAKGRITGVQNILVDITSIAVSDTAPINPKQGDGWFNTLVGSLFIWIIDNDLSGQWVEAVPGAKDGDEGAQGTQGIQGTIGLGTQGSIGESGIQGHLGSQGLTGISIQGTVGESVQGTMGIQGNFGIQGPIGADANTTPYEESFVATEGQTTFILTHAPIAAWVWRDGLAQDATTWSIVGNGIVLANPVSTGVAIEIYYLTGAVLEAGPQGVQGNMGFGLQGSIGSQGVSGTQGTLGIQGQIGESIQGTEGYVGEDGSQGVQGTQGLWGSQGLQGLQGESVQGVQGLQGLQGIFGIQGLSGIQGDIGSQGIQGNVGGFIWVSPPITKNSEGQAKQVAYDGNYFYICTADNVWKRTSLITNWI